MKILSLLIFISLIFSCSTDNSKNDKGSKKDEVLVEIKDGMYTEWYFGKKQIKFKGGQDEQNLRNGRWVYYLENGQENSVTMYEHGLREGFTVVKHPNGALYYRGEYHKDLQVGVWTTYDEKGNLVNEKDFGYPEE
jgi:antitoxin component YwqK of YwqJK toxin-antitoxin module